MWTPIAAPRSRRQDLLYVCCTTQSGSTVEFDGDGYVGYMPCDTSAVPHISGLLAEPAMPVVGQPLRLVIETVTDGVCYLHTSPIMAVEVTTGQILTAQMGAIIANIAAVFSGPRTD